MKITERSDGRYYAKVTKDGKSKYFYGSTKKEVEEKIIKYRYELERGLNVSEGGFTFKELAEKWFDTKQKKKEYNTRQAIRYKLENHIYPAIGDIRVRNLKPYNIQELINDLVDKGFTNTITKVYQHINSILRFGVENDFLNKNIAISVEVPKFKSKPKKALEKDEQKIIEEVAKTHKHGDMIMLFMYTGMRRQELIALRKENIDLKNKVISFDEAMYFKSNQAYLKSTKNGEPRNIPILNKIYPILESRCNEYDNFLFPMYNGKMMSEVSFREAMNSFRKSCKKYTDDHNLPEVNFTAHIFRHTFCSNLYYAGVPLKEAQEIMGHKSARVTLDIYTHLSSQNKSEIVQKINNYFE